MEFKKTTRMLLKNIKRDEGQKLNGHEVTITNGRKENGEEGTKEDSKVPTHLFD